jgi:hypothetical protein
MQHLLMLMVPVCRFLAVADADLLSCCCSYLLLLCAGLDQQQ